MICEILLKVNDFATDKGNSLMRFFIEADFLHNSLVQFLYIKVFWRKMQIWCCSVRIQKGKKKKKKKFKTVLGNLEGKFSVLPSHEAKEKKFFPSDWVSKRMTGLNIDIVKILLLWNVLRVYKNVFESSQEGTFKLVNPKHEHRTERQSGRLSQS